MCFTCVETFLGTVVRGEVGKDVMQRHRCGLLCFALNDAGQSCGGAIAPSPELRARLPAIIQDMMFELAEKENLSKSVMRSLNLKRCEFCGDQVSFSKVSIESYRATFENLRFEIDFVERHPALGKMKLKTANWLPRTACKPEIN